jgi:pimeloyl-ACP methyl ester carboxylesterase
MSASAAPDALPGVRRERLRTRVGSLEYELAGSGAPTFVLFSGAGMTLESWRRVVPEAARLGTVIAWNRFGLEGSDVPQREQSGAVVVAALRELLSYAGVEPPYVLVGHSLGGLYANLFARLRPSEVAGVLLVEATHPHDREITQADVWQLTRALSKVQGVGQECFYENLAAEIETVDLLAQEVEAAGEFPDVPLVVVSGAMAPPESLLPREAFERRQQLQRELARLAPDAEHVVAGRSGHFPQLSEPQLVADALQRLVERCAA